MKKNEEKKIEEKKDDKNTAEEIDDKNNNEIKKVSTAGSTSSYFFGFFNKLFNKNQNDKDLLNNKTINLNAINPLRDMRKLSRSNIQCKKKAIMELVVDLKGQYILFNIRDFIRNYQINTNPNINSKSYKIIRFIRNISLLIYGIIMFFERPWFCYSQTNIPLPDFFSFNKDCENKVVFVNLPFINHYLIIIIEILITSIILITQLIKYKNEYSLKNTNIGVSKSYKIIQIILFISLILCLIDLIVSLITGNFPIINFILRAFIYIYMIRRIRRNWVRIGKILWNTKTVFLFLFMNIFLFSMIGYFLFNREKSQFFNEFHQIVLQLYILLSTCNFPDIMIDTFEISKLSIFYFIIYVFINYFIILSYLKTLYYTKYYKVNKEECLAIIKDIIQNECNKDIFNVKQFKQFIVNQKYKYLLNDEEYNNILILLNLYDRNNDLFTELSKIVEKSNELELVSNTFYGKYILQSKKFEIIINILCIICLTISIYNNIVIITIQFVWSFLLLFELYILIKNIGFKRFVLHHFNRVVFHIFNIIIMICIIILIILIEKNEENTFKYKNTFKILEIFISLRTIRIFVFLDKFRVIKNIYTIIKNSKEMFYRNLFTLYSLFLLFSTFSMLLTGGNIEKDSFANDKVDSIPEEYAYINFNDLSSSFIACFCLLMINNLNILVKSLTFHINSNKIVFQFYFATFYFFSTLIIINIIQTLLLELYLNSNCFMEDENKPKEKNELVDDESDDSEEIENEEEMNEMEKEIFNN